MGFADRNLPGDQVQTVQNREEKKVYAMRALERTIAREGSHSRKEGRELINALNTTRKRRLLLIAGNRATTSLTIRNTCN